MIKLSLPTIEAEYLLSLLIMRHKVFNNVQSDPHVMFALSVEREWIKDLKQQIEDEKEGND